MGNITWQSQNGHVMVTSHMESQLWYMTKKSADE